MVLVVPLVRFVAVQHSLGVACLLSSTLLNRAVRVVLMGYDNCVKPDIFRLSTEVRTTRC
jgi:hypothetical protein